MQKRVRVLFHTTEYRPEFEAVSQEISILKDAFGGSVFEMFSLSRNDRFRQLQNLKLAIRDKFCALHHIYYPNLDLPDNVEYLAYLKKPIIYCVVSKYMGCESEEKMREKLQQIKHDFSHFIVSCKEDEEIASSLGGIKAQTILPGIIVNNFKFHSPPEGNFKLLFASSPLGSVHFESRGIYLMIEALKVLSDTEVVCLWRRRQYDEMKKLVDEKGFSGRIKIVDQVVDVNKTLANVHATVAPFVTFKENKSYPNSIITSLAAGKPVMVSNQIPIAQIVEEEGCGVVIDPTANAFIDGINKLKSNYKLYQQNCIPVCKKYFSHTRLLKDYSKIYSEVAGFPVKLS